MFCSIGVFAPFFFFATFSFLSLLSCVVIWRNSKWLFPVKIWIEIVPTISSQYSGTVYRAREETWEDSERKEIGESKGTGVQSLLWGPNLAFFSPPEDNTRAALFRGLKILFTPFGRLAHSEVWHLHWWMEICSLEYALCVYFSLSAVATVGSHLFVDVQPECVNSGTTQWNHHFRNNKGSLN